MKQSHWRTAAQQRIAQVVQANPNLAGDALRKAISAAYPFGPRAYTPYKIWLSEVNRFFKTGKPIKVDERQLGLLDSSPQKTAQK